MIDKRSTSDFYSIDTKMGSVVFRFNDFEKLTAIEWSSKSKSIEHEAGRPKLGYSYPVSQLIQKTRLFFESGEPIGSVPWNLLDLSSVSEFQKRVYEVAVQIPAGETRTYAWVANKIGISAGCRAVGQALRKNPFPIIVPCHRVVAAKGGLGGFMGQSDPESFEMNLKQQLLCHEKNYRHPQFSFLWTAGMPAFGLSA